jgi:subtilisin family serine protease
MNSSAEDIETIDDPIWKIPDDLVEIAGSIESAPRTWHLPADVWNKIRNRVTGRGITIAILDTGYAEHDDLPKPIAARSFISGESVEDRNEHGTHCAGTALSRDPNIGVALEARLIVGKVLSNGGSGSSSGIAAGVRWALEQGANVVSMSLGGGSSYGPTNEAIRMCQEAGVWVCVAAGNSGFSGRGNTIGWPARSGEGICVGATRADGNIAGFSSGGLQLTVACPGERILSTGINNNYVFKSGTSMATPFMAGLCALAQELMLREGYPILRGISSVVSFLKSISKDHGAPGHDPSFGHGVPVAADFVQLLANDDIRWI